VSAGPAPEVILYGRPECHLCAAARELLVALAGSPPRFAIAEVNIESEAQLHRRYLERIPVIELEGRIIGELVLDPDGLRARLDTLLA
jgi:glutaredoxin